MDKQHPDDLSMRERGILNLLREGFSYKEIGGVFDMHATTARKHAIAARKHFAALHGLDPATLDLAGRGPKLTDQERALLEAYFQIQREDQGPTPPETAHPGTEESRRRWAQDIAQQRRHPGTRGR